MNPDEPIWPFFEKRAEKWWEHDIDLHTQALQDWRSSENTIDSLPVWILHSLKKTKEVKSIVASLI
jgi:hypothetical protein